jgi:hypothetical protein
VSQTAYESSSKGPEKDMLLTRTSYWAGVIGAGDVSKTT